MEHQPHDGQGPGAQQQQQSQGARRNEAHRYPRYQPLCLAGLQRALDPLSEDGAVARFLRRLSQDLAFANAGHASQLAAALAALDSNDEHSLITKLSRETAAARESLLREVELHVALDGRL